MKTIKFLLLSVSVLLFFLPEKAKTQSITIQTGITGGNNKFTFSADDPKNIFKPGEGYEWTVGIPLKLTLNQWVLQTGFFSNSLTLAYYFDSDSGQFGRNSYSSGMSAYRVPFLIGRDLKINEKIAITPHAGISWLTNTRTGYTGEGSGRFSYVLENGEVVPILEYSFDYNSPNRWKFLGELGVDLNYQLFNYFILTGGVSWSYGLQRVQEGEFTYTYQTEPGISNSAILKSNANSRNVHIGIRIPFYLN